MKYFEFYYALKVWGFYATIIILALLFAVVIGSQIYFTVKSGGNGGNKND